MFNTTNLMKFGASAIAALLILMFANWGASALYKVADDAHGGHGDEEHAVVRGYNIAPDHGDDDAEEEEEVVVAFADIYAAADSGKGERVYGKCKACHKLEEGAHATGPSLYGIVGAPIAGVDGFGYSDALTALAGTDWTPEELDAWLADPKGYAPMLGRPLECFLIAYLATIGG